MRTPHRRYACSCPAVVLGEPCSSPAPQVPHAQAPAGGRGAQPGLEPRVVSFEARPATVRAGEPVLLVWQTENPAGVSIAPDIGTVTARGSRTVTPSATTTYTLTHAERPVKDGDGNGASRAVRDPVRRRQTRSVAGRHLT